MKVLNQRGWGLGVFITFIGVFFVAIIIIVYISNKYNVGIENINSKTTSEKIPVTTQKKYEEYEKKVKEKSIIYQENHYPNLSNNEIFYTNINNLDIPSEIKNNCSGYVEFRKLDNIYYYSPYINCGIYTTKGYNSNLDK